MKKALFTTAALALLGGQVLAGVVFTGNENNYDDWLVAGASTEDGSDATGGNLVVSYVEEGGLSGYDLYVSGGQTLDSGAAYGNTVTMTGGQVTGLFGGFALEAASEEDARDNTVNLVGIGATVDINGTTYSGQNVGITADLIGGGCIWGDTGTPRNTINIYGTQITTGVIFGFDTLNINLVNSDNVVLTLGCSLDLGTVELSFGTLDTTIDFDTVTLMETTLDWGSITLSDTQLAQTWDITDTNGVVITTGTLSLENNDKVLKMNFTKTPEPATATLSMLALAGLCARRRRH